MTNFTQGTQKTDNRTDSRNGDSREWNSAALLANNAQFVSVDSIGEKNQVILELAIKRLHCCIHVY